MKILVLCNKLPFPIEHGFNLRVFFLSKYLAETNKVDLLCMHEEEIPSMIHEVFENVITFKKPPSLQTTFFSLDQLSSRSQQAYEYIKKSVENKEYDAILAYTQMLPSIPFPIAIPVIADLVDDAVLDFWRELKSPATLRKKASLLKCVLLHCFFENKYFSKADATITVSEKDANVFSRVVPSCPIHVIQNGVDTEFFKPDFASEENEELIVFEGKMDFNVNEDGAVYFIKEIFPLIKKTHPKAKFVAVGKNPTAKLLKLKSDDVMITGFVDDVRPYILQASVFVCPLRKGAGIKNKLLQAWALGKATVVTSVSTGGLIINEGNNVMVRDDPESFAKAVTDLFDNPKLRKTMGDNAREVIENSYSWEKKVQQLDSLFKELISKKMDS